MPNPHFHARLDMTVEFKPVQVHPRDGGCWYCRGIAPQGMVFSSEFDTNVHLGCVPRTPDPEDREAAIFRSEFGITEEIPEEAKGTQ